MVPTVLIAATEHLAALQQLEEFHDAQVFADTEALRALETIARERPAVVAIERIFASSTRGTAFINRMKADPGLARSEIRIVDADGAGQRAPARRPAATTVGTAPAAVAEAPSAAHHTETRRAPRFDIERHIEVLVDGNIATLVNISVAGAQVVSAATLRPNQRVRLSLAEAERPLRFSGVVAWATFEIPKDGPRYRAGIQFTDAAPQAVERFIASVTG